MTARERFARQIAAQCAVDHFRSTYPLGTRCRFWPGVREGEGKVGSIQAAAHVLCGTPCVWVVDESGHGQNVALTHVEPAMLCAKCQSELESAADIMARLEVPR